MTAKPAPGPISPHIDPRCVQLGMELRPPEDTQRLHWELSHIWITEHGSWDGVPDWARPYQNDHLGGDHHVYMLAYRVHGSLAKEADLFMLRWPDSAYKFSPKPAHGWWGNAVLEAGFDWQAGQAGPYSAQMTALSSTLVQGIGLPYPPYPWDESATAHTPSGGVHTSFFLVFQEVPPYDPDPGPDPEPAPDPDQLGRVLEKAEHAADELHVEGYYDQAADTYLAIARLLQGRDP